MNEIETLKMALAEANEAAQTADTADEYSDAMTRWWDAKFDLRDAESRD